MELSRREFMRSAGGATLTLCLERLSFGSLGAARTAHADPLPLPNYAAWEDVYRNKWTWDNVVRSSHFLNCWYQAHCAWDVYVKDGMVWREEQAADYPAVRSDTPDFNPRGCQKGACYSARMYDPARVKIPAEARRPARIGEVGAHLVGAGAQ